MSGSVMDFAWESSNVEAILQAWYGGQSAGEAIVDVLFGDYNPGGRMPLTTYCSVDDLPPFDSYSMENRTYRYFKGKVRYPFGYGLSYTTFAYSGLACQPEVTTGQKVEVSVKVKNTGKREGDEVVQLYVAHPQDGQTIRPIRSLKGFRRVHLQAGEEREVRFTLTPEDLALCDRKGNLVQQAGNVSIFVGGGQPGHAEGSSCQLAMKGDAYGCF